MLSLTLQQPVCSPDCCVSFLRCWDPLHLVWQGGVTWIWMISCAPNESSGVKGGTGCKGVENISGKNWGKPYLCPSLEEEGNYFQAPNHFSNLENSFLLRPNLSYWSIPPEEGEGWGSKFLLVPHDGKAAAEGAQRGPRVSHPHPVSPTRQKREPGALQNALAALLGAVWIQRFPFQQKDLQISGLFLLQHEMKKKKLQ